MNQLVIMNFSGAYEQQSFYQDKAHTWLEFTKLQGVNGYCSEEAEAEISRSIQNLSYEGIHFLDSGNYHYVSKCWLKKIQEPFSLLLWDQHTDMQESAFFGLLSCGSWVREARLSIPHLKETGIMGPPKKLFLECHEEDRLAVTAIEQEALLTQGTERLKHFLNQNTELPLYLSIDKDVLCTEDARTNWDQGGTRLAQLLTWIEMAFASRRILGVDICGENPASSPKREDMEINNQTNQEFCRFLTRQLQRQNMQER